MNQDESQIRDFKSLVWEYYHQNKENRLFEWRKFPTSYNVLVSEFMLQQTQTSRVVSKYAEFMELFPTIEALAFAPWEEVMKAWVGLGYNRRARNLHLTAQRVVNEFQSELPIDKATLMSLPGIGDYTSSAIRAFAFNKADPFIETNIRTVYLHHFFGDQFNIDDKQIMPLIEQTLDHENPREWYWALMDYGVFLKQTFGNQNTRSKHYSRQSKYQGSSRQLRSDIIKSILANKEVSKEELEQAFLYDKRAPKLIESLVKEGMIRYNGKYYSL